MTDAVSLARELIRRRSVTPDDDGAQAVLAAALAPLGFACRDVPFGTIKNLFARLGTPGSRGPHLCFCGHTDVVPAGDESLWTHPPFAADISGGVLYGRGAADMKGNIACFVAAISRFIDRHGAPRGSVSLLITGDEEGVAVDGTVKVLKWMKENGHTPDHALVGEPSNPNAHGDEIKIGRRGSLSGRITVRGRQGHVAYPHLADNPLPRMLRLLSALSGHKFDDGTDHFQPTNLQLVTIDTGNAANNVIPGAVTAAFNARFNDLWTSRTLADAVCRVLDGVGETYEIEFWSGAESFMTAPGDFTALVADAAEEVCGRRPALTTNGGTSDARFVSRYCPVVEYGLCNKTIHHTDEHVALSDMEQLTDIYLRVLEKYFGAGQ